MKWIKKGLLYCHKNLAGEAGYTTAPFAQHLQNDVFRVYFSARDDNNRSYPLFIDVDVVAGQAHNFKCTALLKPGAIGAFDDAGCILFQIVNHQQKRFLYYAGWSLAQQVPFKCFIGLAIANNDSNNFEKFSEAPILNSNKHNPYITGSPWVLVEDGLWRMWYLSGLKWQQQHDNTVKHYYNITYAESTNGIDWNPSGIICIPFNNHNEYAIARPQVIKHNGIYKMWYSYRETETCKTYQIGYAESNDGITWIRKDEEAGIEASPEGWDSEMICYPFVFEHKQKFYMLYNGNAYGKTGVGIAELIEW
jgi:hypothetical protein